MSQIHSNHSSQSKLLLAGALTKNHSRNAYNMTSKPLSKMMREYLGFWKPIPLNPEAIEGLKRKEKTTHVESMTDSDTPLPPHPSSHD